MVIYMGKYALSGKLFQDFVLMQAEVQKMLCEFEHKSLFECSNRFHLIKNCPALLNGENFKHTSSYLVKCFVYLQDNDLEFVIESLIIFMINLIKSF